MPSFGQNGGAMNDSLAQHSAQTPSPSTGSRQATHSVGSAMSSASRAACTHAPRHAASATRRWVEMDRDGDAAVSMGGRLASGRLVLKPGRVGFSSSLPADLANARPMTGFAEKWTNGVQVVLSGERNLFTLAVAIDRGQTGHLHLLMRNYMQRRLAAILAADVVGYSRLMGTDEMGTLTALKSHRRELV